MYFGGSDDLRAKIASTPQDSTSTTSTVSSTPSTSSTPVSTSTLTSGYKDGTYTASASYDVPHGATNSISVKVTLSGGKDTDVFVNDDYSDHESQMYISRLESALKDTVPGQDLASLSPSRIGGASLTTYAFDQVLDTIRSQAHS